MSTLTASVPFLFSQKADAASTIAVNAANTQGWITDDTRANGYVSFVPDASAFGGNGALSMKTDATPVAGQDKAQYMHYFTTPVPLSSITGELSFDTKQNSALFAAGTPSYQIPVYLNGPTGTNFATLVYEPYVDQGNAGVQNGVWQHWMINPSSSKIYSSKTVTGQNGNIVSSQGSSTYTLDQIKQYFPNATVLGFGLNVGSNNPGYDTEADNFTFNGTTYDFVYTALAAPTNLKPVNNSYTNNASFDNTWNAVSGAVKYEYTASYMVGGSSQVYTDTSDAGNYVLGGSTITRHNSGAPNSTYTWKVRAIDANGVAGAWSADQKVTVDTIAPAPEFVTPAVNEKVFGTTTIKVNVNDLNPNYTYLEINQNGAWKAATTLSGATPTWNFDTTTLPDGNYTVKADVIDQAGNGTEITRNFKIGNPPVVTGIYPVDGSFIHGVTTVGLHTTDSNLSYTYIEFNQNGSWKTDNTTSGSVALGSTNAGNDPKLVLNTANYADGAYGVKIDSVDTQGNTTEKLLHYTVDNQAPDLTVKIGTEGGQQLTIGSAGRYKVVSFKLHDNNQVVKYVINGTVTNVTPAPWTDANFISANDSHGAVVGDNTIVVYDIAGNTTVLHFTLDNSATAPTLVSPADGAIVNGASVTQTWSTTDTDIDHYVYESYNDAAATSLRFTANYTATSKTATNVANGSVYYWRVKAVDNLGNESLWSPLWKISVDSTAPTATLIFPARGPSATSFQVKFSEAVNVADAKNPANYFLTNWPGAGGSGDLTGHAGVTYDATSNTATVSFTTPGWYVSGEQLWGVSGVHDLAGNVMTTTSAFSSDNIAPTAPANVATTTPTNGLTSVWTWGASTDPENVSDGASGVKGYEYQLTQQGAAVDDSAWIFTTATTASTTVTSEGNYVLHVRAIDNAGNVGSESTSDLTVDTTGPTVSVNPGNFTTTQPTITGTVGADTVKVTTAILDQNGKLVENGTASSVPGTTTWSYAVQTVLANANYTIFARAYDALGNFTDSAANIFAVAVPAPTVPTTVRPVSTPIITSPAAAAVLGATTDNTGTQTGDTGVKGTTDDKTLTAAAVTSDANKGTVFGLAWYWWILILAALAAIAWFITAAIRRRNEAQV
ncbi:MAG TPA: hypothetical protein VIM31_04905 [Candidatus Microsaccharimonas sp.]